MLYEVITDRQAAAGKEGGKSGQFHGVVEEGGGAVGADCGDRLRSEPGHCERLAHRLDQAAAVAGRRRDVMGIVGRAPAEQGRQGAAPLASYNFV